MAPPPTDNTVATKLIDDTVLYLVFKLLSKEDLTNTAQVNKQWHQQTMPYLNKVVDITFSWTYKDNNLNDNLLDRLNSDTAIANQVREIRILDHLPPREITTVRQPDSDFGAFGQLSEWAANKLILGPQGQLQQLIHIIPRLRLQRVVWVGHPSAPDSLLSMISLQTSLEFEICFGTNRLQREEKQWFTTRIKFLNNIHVARVQNLTRFEYHVPVEVEGQRLLHMLGEVIRANPNLRVLSLVVLGNINPAQQSCPWVVDDGPINKPFPPILKLKLIQFGMNTQSATDQEAWSKIIQWDKLEIFSTDHSPFFTRHATPHIKRLALLRPSEVNYHVHVEYNSIRQTLADHAPLTYLVLHDEYLLSSDVWNTHKHTLVSLTLHKTHSRTFVYDLQTLPQLRHLAMDLSERPPGSYAPSTLKQIQADTVWPSSGPTLTAFIDNLIHIEHLELSFLTSTAPPNLCQRLWDIIWRNLLAHGTVVYGPTWRPRLRQLDLDVMLLAENTPGNTSDRPTRYQVTLSNNPVKKEQGECVVKNLDSEYLGWFYRRYYKDVPEGDRDLEVLMKKWSRV